MSYCRCSALDKKILLCAVLVKSKYDGKHYEVSFHSNEVRLIRRESFVLPLFAVSVQSQPPHYSLTPRWNVHEMVKKLDSDLMKCC
eukprot:m.484020 g.484020  ORF g.484020 m.484020 type:complete len:86 (-) comp21730_c1_seq10:7-264(-)